MALENGKSIRSKGKAKKSHYSLMATFTWMVSSSSRKIQVNTPGSIARRVIAEKGLGLVSQWDAQSSKTSTSKKGKRGSSQGKGLRQDVHTDPHRLNETGSVGIASSQQGSGSLKNGRGVDAVIELAETNDLNEIEDAEEVDSLIELAVSMRPRA